MRLAAAIPIEVAKCVFPTPLFLMKTIFSFCLINCMVIKSNICYLLFKGWNSKSKPFISFRCRNAPTFTIDFTIFTSFCWFEIKFNLKDHIKQHFPVNEKNPFWKKVDQNGFFINRSMLCFYKKVWSFPNVVT